MMKSEESNKEDDVKVSGIQDNAAVNDGNSQVNPARDIHSSVPGNVTAMFATANQPWKKGF